MIPWFFAVNKEPLKPSILLTTLCLIFGRLIGQYLLYLNYSWLAVVLVLRSVEGTLLPLAVVRYTQSTWDIAEELLGFVAICLFLFSIVLNFGERIRNNVEIEDRAILSE